MNRHLATAAASIALLAVASGPALAGEHIIRAERASTITFYACPYFSVLARGDGDTDLDFELYSPSGRLLHSDYDLTDWTAAEISRGGCGTYRLRVENLGPVWNAVNVSVSQ